MSSTSSIELVYKATCELLDSLAFLQSFWHDWDLAREEDRTPALWLFKLRDSYRRGAPALAEMAMTLAAARFRSGRPVMTMGDHAAPSAHELVYDLAESVLVTAREWRLPTDLPGDPVDEPDDMAEFVAFYGGFWSVIAQELNDALPALNVNLLAAEINSEFALLKAPRISDDSALGLARVGDNPEDRPRVVLRGREAGPIVLDKTKQRLTTPQYNVVKALLDAGDAGLTKDELVSKSGHEDARGILKRLTDSDPDWKKVIHFAGQTGGGYRIK